jgi:hypothetical protein
VCLGSNSQDPTVESFGDVDGGGAWRIVDEVFYSTPETRQVVRLPFGVSAVGLWIQEGDTLLIVVKDYVDGTCHAVPLQVQVPPPDAPDAQKEQRGS